MAKTADRKLEVAKRITDIVVGEYGMRAEDLIRGEAEQVIQQAEGYALERVNRSEGEAARFNSIYQEYAQAPDVTRRRMFLETMERVLGRSELIILDQNGNGQGAVPYLPLDQLGRNRGARSEAAGSGQGGN